MTQTTTKLTNEQVLQDLSQTYMKLKGELSETEERRKHLKSQLSQMTGAISVLQQIEESNKPEEEVTEEEEVKPKKGFK